MDITIRPIAMADLSAVEDIFTNKHVFQHFDNGPWTSDKIAASVHKNVERWADGSVGSHVICLDNIVVGRMAVYPNANGEYELGYVLNQRYWGKGIAKKAAQLGIGFVEGSTSARHIIAYARSTNTASIHILLALGFKETSTKVGEDDILRIRYAYNTKNTTF